MKYMISIVISLILFYLVVSYVLWDLQWFFALQHMNALGRIVVLLFSLIAVIVGMVVCLSISEGFEYEDDEVMQ